MKALFRSQQQNSHQLGIALLLSACAHGGWLAMALRAPAERGVAAVGQRKGEFTVVNLVRPQIVQPASHSAARPRMAANPALPPAKARQNPILPRILPSAAALPETKPEPPPSPPTVESSATTTETEPASATSPAPPPAAAPARPGAQFASLFAPILSRPLGRGRWGAPPAPMPPPPDPAQLRQQATLALTAELMQRLGSFTSEQISQGAAAHCDVKVEMTSREALVNCEQAEDAAQVWAVLHGLFRPATTTPVGHDRLCVQLNSNQTLVQTCPVDAPMAKTQTNGTAP
ncbi:MAG: hypothetical protein EOP38_00070 [Rubrivivax sp.]|nr:MAG: hypothetical protein EOP38_00070 [Rubrivivax sp.]